MRGPYKPKNRGMLLSTYLLCSLSPASELNLHRFPRESWTFMIPNDDSVLQIEEFLIYCAKSGGIVVCVFSFPSCFALWCNYMKLCHSKGGQNSERAQTFSSKKKLGKGVLEARRCGENPIDIRELRRESLHLCLNLLR